MKTTTALCLALTFLFVGCSADTGARRFVRKQTRAGCRTTKKCNKLAWNDLDHRSVGACVEEELEDFEDAFVDNCDDYDPQKARECLAGMRAIRRSCDAEAASDDQIEACAEVCGNTIARSWPAPTSTATIATWLANATPGT